MPKVQLIACGVVLAACAASASATQALASASVASSIQLPIALREPVKVVDAFHAALAAGQTARASELLSEDAIIFESGGAERGKGQYTAHHLAADAAFAQAVPSIVSRRSGHAVGDIAWVASESRTRGFYKGKAIDSLNTETMVLRRTGEGWRIVHVHWSSRTPKA